MGAGRRSGGEACGGGSGGPWSVNDPRNNERGDFSQCVEGKQVRRCRSFHYDGPEARTCLVRPRQCVLLKHGMFHAPFLRGCTDRGQRQIGSVGPTRP